jgi:valyl-tRNA synthetase
MLIMGVEFMGDVPFRDIYLHALVRDEFGQKMSKSKGNVIDPHDMINEYSSDTLRFTLARLAAQGRDIRLSTEKIILSRNFTNKLFNATKFLLMNHKEFNEIEIKTPLGRYMFYLFNQATKDIISNLDSYRFNDAALAIYKFLWDDFCDWGIELSKVSKDSIIELGYIFKLSMKLLHPFMPFISEYLYMQLSNQDFDNFKSIMIEEYPKVIDCDNVDDFEVIKDAIVSIRRAKVLINEANQKIDNAYIKVNRDIDYILAKPYIEFLGKVINIEFVSNRLDGYAVDVGEYVESFVKMSDSAREELKIKLSKQREKLQKEFDKLSNMLKNEKFVANAPANVIEENRANLTQLTEKISNIDSEIERL